LDTSLPIHVIEFLERKGIPFKSGSIADELSSIAELGQTATLDQFKYSLHRLCSKLGDDAVRVIGLYSLLALIALLKRLNQYSIAKDISIEQFLKDQSEVERSILYLVDADKIHPLLEQFLVRVDDLAPALRHFLLQEPIRIPTNPSVDQLLAVLDNLHIYRDLEYKKKLNITKHCLQSIVSSGQDVPKGTIKLLGQDNQYHKSSDLWIPCPTLCVNALQYSFLAFQAV
jgi:hypothetical protein